MQAVRAAEAVQVPQSPQGPLIPQQQGRDGFDGFAAFGTPESASAPDAPFAPDAPPASADEWNPTADSAAPLRGKHRVAKQRGSLARSSTVLGVGVIAAVGAGGIATAQDKPAVSISLPDQLAESLDSLADSLPDATSLPGVGALLSDSAEEAPAEAGVTVAAAPAAAATPASAGQQPAGAGESLRARILQQAEQQRTVADEAVRQEARDKAVQDAAAEAKKAQQQADATARQAEKEKAEKEAREKAAAEAEAKAEAEAARLARLAASYSLPTSSYTLTSTYGQSGSMWSSGQHTGLDFAAPTGTPVKAVHGGTVTSAGWSGSYGYRVVLELKDGTEIWYCHLSQMNVAAGTGVATGQTIGNVGATGNVTGPHLHLEVHTPGGAGVDPAAWLRGKGLTV
ncbi:M23 family metallopeptidase [Streptomyces sp. NPDC088745]|uniref:M23 family metallopeptidase n=1 Tax=Streptomyces sp. NPDC088745 TaxID=3365884 RepID=UPI00382A82E2